MKRNTRTDARTIETDKIIKETLIAMIREMDYPQITITELTNRAGIHRKTFYLHYESIESLFDSLVDDIVGDMQQMMDKLFGENIGLNLARLGNEFINLLNNNKNLHQKLFCNDTYGIIYNKIQAKSCEYLLTKLSHFLEYDAVTLENDVYFISYGLNAVVRRSFQAGRIDDKDALERWAVSMNELMSMGMNN